MRQRTILYIFLGGLISAMPAVAQQDMGAIRVTTTLLPDGSRIESKTDPAARTVESTTIDPNDNVKERAIYYGNALSGQVDRGEFFSPDGKLLYKASYTRDSQGRITEEARYGANGRLEQRKTYDYGADGRVVAVKTYGPDGELTHSASRPAGDPLAVSAASAGNDSPSDDSGSSGKKAKKKRRNSLR